MDKYNQAPTTAHFGQLTAISTVIPGDTSIYWRSERTRHTLQSISAKFDNIFAEWFNEGEDKGSPECVNTLDGNASQNESLANEIDAKIDRLRMHIAGGPL